MIHQMKSDNSKVLSASRKVRQCLPRSVARAIKANPSNSEINLDATWAAKVPFAEDFLLEHSLGGPHVISMEISSIF